MRRIQSSILSLLLLSSASGVLAQAPPEMRACWVSRFEWPQNGEANTKAKITQIMQTLKQNNFNAVLFQIRGDCSTLYPSPYEPWATQFGWTNPGWDPVAFAIQEAKANGLEFHAYINTHTITGPIPPLNTTPQHIYNLHARAGVAENWSIHDESGTPTQIVDGYVWLSPGIPDAEAMTRRAIMHVVDTYDIDGLHFDRIRTPGPEYSHDPISEARFIGDGNPDNLEWGDFMRSQITRQLRLIYGATMQKKPHINLSAAPFGICRKVPGGYNGSGTESYYSWNQDSFGWMENRVLDTLFPQIYWDIGSAHPYEVLLADFLARDGGRHIYGGSVTTRDYIAQVYETRNQGALGNTVFSFNSVNFASYLNGPYQEPAPVPELPWKTTPTAAIVVGYARDKFGNEITDALIKRSSDSYNHLSSGDGFYSIIEIPPGEYTFQASKQGIGADTKSATVAAGDVIQLDFILRESRGKVQLNKAVYLLGENILIDVVDDDLDAVSSITVNVTSTTESAAETVTLNAVQPGLFRGQITTDNTSPSIPSDGLLQVSIGDTVVVSYSDADVGNGEGPAVITAQAIMDPQIIAYYEPMDDAPPAGYTFEGTWQVAAPQGSTGNNGFSDPTAGINGPMVLSSNPTGNTPASLLQTEWATSTLIDLSGGRNSVLTYSSWLNSGPGTDDLAAFEISRDGNTWIPIWSNAASAATSASSWLTQQFNLSDFVDGQENIRLRWGIGPTNATGIEAGWNIDEVTIIQEVGRRVRVTVDNVHPTFSIVGEGWRTSAFGNNYGANKHYIGNGTGTRYAQWDFPALPPGRYLAEFWVNNAGYARDANYRVWDDGAPETGSVVVGNQYNQGDGFHTLGEFVFTGGSATIRAIDQWADVGNYTVADALRLTSIELFDATPPEDRTSKWMIY